MVMLRGKRCRVWGEGEKEKRGDLVWCGVATERKGSVRRVTLTRVLVALSLSLFAGQTK